MKKLAQQKYIITVITLFAVVSFLTSILYINQANNVLLNTYVDSIYTESKSYFRMLSNLEDKLNSITYQILHSNNAVLSFATNDNPENDAEVRNVLRNEALKNNLTEIHIYHEKSKKLISYTTGSLQNTDSSTIRKIASEFSKDVPWYYLEQSDASNKLYYVSRDFSGFLIMYSVNISTFNGLIEQFSDNSLKNFVIYYNDTYIVDSSSLINNVFNKIELSAYNFDRLSNKSFYKEKGNLYICAANYRYTIIVKQPISAFSSYKLKAMQKFIFVLIAIFCGFIITLYLLYMISKQKIISYTNILKTHSISEYAGLSTITKCAYTGTPVTPETLSNVTEQLKTYNSFICVIAQADFTKHNKSSYPVADSLKILSAIITRDICDTYNCCPVICNNDTIIITIYSENVIDADILSERLSHIQSKFYAETSITSSYLIGEVFQDSTEIYATLTAIKQLSEFRFLYGYNSIVKQSILSSNRNTQYPENIVHEIINSIIHSAPRHCLELMDKFFDIVISSNSPLVAKEWIASMVFSLIKETQYMYNHSSSKGFDHLKQILDCTTIDECILMIQNMFPEIELIRTPVKVSPTEIFKHQVAAIIADEYMNPNINLAYLAEKTTHAPAYFGQKFLKEFGTQFNVYLSNYRINCSMKLLSNTNDKIADIALQCGFSSAAYFTKAFREHTNMTPSQYRTKYTK